MHMKLRMKKLRILILKFDKELTISASNVAWIQTIYRCLQSYV